MFLAQSARNLDTIPTAIEEASALLGRPIEVVDHRYGAIMISAVAEGGDYAGEATDRNGCDRTVWSEPRGVILAHELGHALGLDHDDDPANLMHRYVGRDTIELTPDQEHDLEHELWLLNTCTLRSSSR